MSPAADGAGPAIASGPQKTAPHTFPENAKRKHVRNVALVVAGAFVGLLFLLLVTPVVRVTPENCARIKPGMTQQQVEAILGGPPDLYDGIGGFEYLARHPMGKGSDGLEWTARGGDVEIVFDGNGRVLKATFSPIRVLVYDDLLFVIERVTRCTLSRWESWWMWG